MKLARPVFGAVFAAIMAFVPSPGEAAIVEKIVAVVGDHPILLSELRARARGDLAIMTRKNLGPDWEAGERPRIYKKVIDEMIDERVEERAAEKGKIPPIGTAEIDKALSEIAKQEGTTVAELVRQARAYGMSEQEHRDTIRRSLLSDALVQQFVLPRVRVTLQDGRAVYQTWRREMGKDFPVQVRMIVLAPAKDSRMPLARDLVSRARKGEDFCKLVNQYSDLPEAKKYCGRSAPMASQSPPEMMAALKRIKPGEFADAVELQDGAVVVLNLLSELRPPLFEDVRDQMMTAARAEAIKRQRKIWLMEMRRGVYTDIRLL